MDSENSEGRLSMEARLNGLLSEVCYIEGKALLGSKAWYGYIVNARENIKAALEIERTNNEE